MNKYHNCEYLLQAVIKILILKNPRIMISLRQKIYNVVYHFLD